MRGTVRQRHPIAKELCKLLDCCLQRSFDRLPVANIDVGPANSLHTSNCLDLFGYLRSTRKIAVGNHNMSPPLRSQQSHLTSDPAAPTNDQSSPPAKLLLRRPPANCAYPLNHFAKPFTAVRRN